MDISGTIYIINLTYYVLILEPIFHCDAKFWRRGLAQGNTLRHQNFALGIPTCWYLKTLTFALAPTPTPDASQWKIGGVGSSGVDHVYFMYISCIFHVYFMLFVHHFPRWLRENWPTQRQIPVEYGL